MGRDLVRFDWAIKRLLRNKADYVVVEGLLTCLLERPIKIKNLLESESNKESIDDKFNRVDVLAEDEDGELLIFEIQNNRELDYFHRMAYGTSKVISEYLRSGEPYENIKKVYSINIVYFSLGQGDGYVYKGTTQFVSIHDENDILKLSAAQRKAFGCDAPSDIFPEYYLLRVDKFDEVAKTPLDEWISFLKSGEIPVTATAPGLAEARERLRVESLSESERQDYYRMMENLRYQRSVIKTGYTEGLEEGMAKGIEEGRAEGVTHEKVANARGFKAAGVPTEVIAKVTGLSVEEIEGM